MEPRVFRYRGNGGYLGRLFLPDRSVGRPGEFDSQPIGTAIFAVVHAVSGALPMEMGGDVSLQIGDEAGGLLAAIIVPNRIASSLAASLANTAEEGRQLHGELPAAEE